jgi:hypothetical protein
MAKAIITISDVIQDDGSMRINTEINFFPDLTQEFQTPAQLAGLRLWLEAEKLIGAELVPS